jgi:hypothetical protein
MICSNEGCNKEFEAKTHNMKYCSDICCREATNAKIKQKYYEKKERLAGKKRTCATKGCTTILSRYNPDSICGTCESREKSDERKSILNAIINVTS